MAMINLDELNDAPPAVLRLAAVCFFHNIGMQQLSNMSLEQTRAYGQQAGIPPAELVSVLIHLEGLNGTLDPDDPRFQSQ
jgi:uncharacterized membrane protein YphA (DoxX/SURF4 family)